MALFWGITDSIGYTQIAITLCASIVLVIKKEITVGELMVFTSYSSLLVWPARQLGRILADLGKASVSLGRLDEVLSVPAESEPGLALTPEIKGNIEFRHVSFGYEDGQDVLRDISFTAHKGETVAILGSTGSGKSSLVQLLQRLYTCREGEILIDGVNVNDIERHHLRRNVGIVLQEPFLYSRTIMENIKITNPGASDDEAYGAAAVAAIHEAIKEFENGYETVVGERGVTLSGGQKQRVAIARMLMQKAPIIVLDDSMSAVDTETDAAIRDALAARGRTARPSLSRIVSRPSAVRIRYSYSKTVCSSKRVPMNSSLPRTDCINALRTYRTCSKRSLKPPRKEVTTNGRTQNHCAQRGRIYQTHRYERLEKALCLCMEA